MVRDPSIVSPSLTGVFIGGGHNKHGTGSRCTLPQQCRPPSPRRRWRCDRSSYKRSLFSRIRDSLMHYLTGPETTETPPVTVSDLCGIEPLRDGQAHRSELRLSLTCRGPPTCVYLLRENPLGPGRQHTRLDIMGGRVGPVIGGRFKKETLGLLRGCSVPPTLSVSP